MPVGSSYGFVPLSSLLGNIIENRTKIKKSDGFITWKGNLTKIALKNNEDNGNKFDLNKLRIITFFHNERDSLETKPVLGEFT